MENFERIKELVNELKRIVDEMDKERGFQSTVGKSFQERLAKNMELKQLSKISDEL